jgi:hypothetical protein
MPCQGELPLSDIHKLTLSEVRQRLEDRGVRMALSTLSEFTNAGDISDMLEVGGTTGKREFLPDTVEILAAFFPEYKAAGGRLPQAARLLRSFLKRGNDSDITPFRTASDLALSETSKPDALQIARAQGIGQQDRVFTAKEASEFLRVSVLALRKYGPKPFRRFGETPKGDRWRVSDLLK